ncbi:site-2 protease family protein [Patescibacteria group bacterium]|nr:site-2 protease family protein [Patescibacteria group bacterium]
MFFIIVFIVILGLLVFVHELGHFLAAKAAGAKVEEFGFGFPPKIFGIKKGETTYSINLIPLGGFVKIMGEDGGGKKDPRSFSSKGFWARIGILVSGVTMNVLLAMILLAIGFWVGLPLAVDDDDAKAKFRDPRIQVIEVAKDSPAAAAGINPTDQVLKIDDKDIATVSDYQEVANVKAGQEVAVTILSGGSEKTVNLLSRDDPPEDEGRTGIALVKTGIVSYPFLTSVVMGVEYTFVIMKTVVIFFSDLISKLVVGQPVTFDVTGPVGIARMTRQATTMGFSYLIQLTALLSVNLAIVNILPLPALDGGRILFIIIEKIRRKPLNQRIEGLIHTAGFILLMLLMVVITFRDVFKFKEDFFGLWDKLAGLF